MPTWTFVRHGEAQSNAEGWFAGHVDAPLTPRGREQAVALGEQLRTLAIDRVLCSDLVRARQTAELALAGRGLPIEYSAALRERHGGAWERRTLEDLDRSGDMQRLMGFDGAPPDGESLRQVARRVLGYLVTREAPGHTLVVAHGALMRGVVGVLDDIPMAEYGRWRPSNCELVTRTLSPGTLATLLSRL